MYCTEGVTQLREKWSQYKQPKKLRKMVSLFISPSGERVAVAAGNQITILQRKDDYAEPCGRFTSKMNLVVFVMREQVKTAMRHTSSYSLILKMFSGILSRFSLYMFSRTVSLPRICSRVTCTLVASA